MENFLNLKKITVLFPFKTKTFTFTFSFAMSVMTQAHVFACCDVFFFQFSNLDIATTAEISWGCFFGGGHTP